MKKIDWKDLGKRALKTFVQAFAASFAIDGIVAAGDFDAMKAALVGATVAALAAGISAAMNTISMLTKASDDNKEE